jgi:hypothetical protein
VIGAGADAQAPPAWREAPPFVRLFAPAPPRADAYRAYVTTEALDEALREVGAWEARRTAPFDAFGQAGRYDRVKLARAYGARQPLVARGTRTTASGREMWTLISPYPDAELQGLQPGTLLIVLKLP